MPRRYQLGPCAQIPKGEGRTFVVEGERIAVFRLRSDAVHAVQATCPHRGGPLADGLTGDGTVICPLHEKAFDLGTGAGIGHDDCIRAYRTEVSPVGMISIIMES